ncbi:MAG: response regulator [Firmicutes bacterium]|nr:response regulator [Alicyclobacillaceae bacterium]MCL6498065.1 response regulator [Bacillota bacterium]
MPTVLLVDDSALARVLLQQRFRRRGWRVAWAGSGSEALARWADVAPDLITMDVEMPGMNGVETVRRLREAGYHKPLVMLSGFTRTGAEVTVEALAAGADDFVLKPAEVGELDQTVDTLVQKWVALSRRPPAASTPKAACDLSAEGVALWCLAASTGGPRALAELCQAAPEPPAPVVMVQHMPAGFTGPFSQRLTRLAGWPVVEVPSDGRPRSLWEAPAWLAAGGRHLRLNRRELWTELGPRRHGVIPAADVTLEDAAQAFGPRLGVVVLTGMGEDGAAGAKQARQAGARVVVEAPETAVVWGMPRAVVEAGAAEAVWPLGRIRTWLHRAWAHPVAAEDPS